MISAKEEAKELFDKMYNTEHCRINHFPNKHYCDCSQINQYQAQQCALIAVDEILKSHYIALIGVKPSIYNHYQEVKKEIELL